MSAAMSVVIRDVDFDIPDIKRRLNDAERRVFTNWESRVLDFYQDRWTGWRYEGRPAGDPRLVSYDAWTTQVRATAEGPELTVENKARDYRTGTNAYVSFVTRSGASRPEWEVVTDEFIAEQLPILAQDLSNEIARSAANPVEEPRPRSGDGPSETLRLEL